MIGALVSAATGIIGGVVGMIGGNKAAKHQANLAKEQKAEANKLRQEALDTRVDYKTPTEINDMLANAQRDSAVGSELSQSVSDTANKQLANQTGGIQRTATSGAQALAAMNAASSGTVDKIAEAEEKQLSLNNQKKANLSQAQQVAAGFSDKEYDVNVTKEFERLYGESEALKGAGIQNEAGAIKAKGEAMAALGSSIGGAGKTLGENVDFGALGFKKK